MKELVMEYQKLDKESKDIRKDMRVAFKDKNIEDYNRLVRKRSKKTARMDKILDIVKKDGQLEDFIRQLK